eukprot:672278-Heterocapsa_arctica.AAC.1
MMCVSGGKQSGAAAESQAALPESGCDRCRKPRTPWQVRLVATARGPCSALRQLRTNALTKHSWFATFRPSERRGEKRVPQHHGARQCHQAHDALARARRPPSAYREPSAPWR